MFYVSAWFYSLMWLGQPIYIGPFVDQQACTDQWRAHGWSQYGQAGACFEGLDIRAYARGDANDDHGLRGLWVVTNRVVCRPDDADDRSPSR